MPGHQVGLARRTIMRLSVLVSLLPLVAAGPTRKRAEPAPILAARGDTKDIVADKYIVKFKEGSALADVEEAFKMLDDEPANVYSDGVFTGFAGMMKETNLEAIRQHPEVEYIEPVSMMTTQGFVSQGGAPWGLSRLSSRWAGSDSYVFDDAAGEGTCSYIIDSGIDAQHPEFEGRATFLGHFGPGPHHDDCGHGTHVAGTIGSRTYGVAKRTRLYGIKALGFIPEIKKCAGDTSDIIKAVNAVAHDAPGRDCPKGVIVNMSLGGGYSQALNDAVDNLSARGIFVAAASGNANTDARGDSPASASRACVVGATDRWDRRFEMSNFGPNIDINAPGVDILSTMPNGQVGTMTGTSMASPHIAGLAAYLAAKDGLSGFGLCQAIQQMATPNAIVDQVWGTRNLLAFNGASQW
ncbi:oryzin precursor [Cordyceps militaris]|uniref:Oryzin n=1 Tax=Cordyceps militaris TaxID=73501 RepID=A0A2H4SSX3_CORMI|nr:oryzin precursor [Cordyceps militaris]